MSTPQIIMDGLGFGESLRWHDGRLWFSNWATQEVTTISPAGTLKGVLHAPSFPFCFDWLPDGQLLVVSGNKGLLMSKKPSGALEKYADLTVLAETPWKDIAVDGRGNAYVGNIGFNFPQEAFLPGILALVTPDGGVRQVADELEFPHGIVVTPDGKTLIVAEAYASRLTAFDIAKDGSLKNRRVWADLAGGSPHGICLDAEGAIWYADIPNNECVRVREGGEVLQTISLDRSCFACVLGGENGKTLFMMTADWQGASSMADGAKTGKLLTIRAPAASVGWPK